MRRYCGKLTVIADLSKNVVHGRILAQGEGVIARVADMIFIEQRNEDVAKRNDRMAAAVLDYAANVLDEPIDAYSEWLTPITEGRKITRRRV